MTYSINHNQHDFSTYTELYQPYSSDIWKDIIKLHCAYLRERPYGTLNGRLIPIVYIAGGSFLGYLAATKIAERLQIEKGRPLLQASGAVAGGTFGVYHYITCNEKDIFFKTWKFLKLSSIFNEFIFKNIENDTFLNKFLDCIHYTPLRVSVRLATGHLVDLDTLRNIKPDENGDTLCPHTRDKLNLNNPNIDLELQLLIFKRVQYLIQQDMVNVDQSSEKYNLLKLQLDFIEKQICFCHEKYLKGLEILHSDGRITRDELNRLRAQFYQYFGFYAIGNADEENEVVPHVMNFDLDWKKIIINHSKVVFKGTPPTQFIENI